jgi:hypothetical protein
VAFVVAPDIYKAGFGDQDRNNDHKGKVGKIYRDYIQLAVTKLSA